MSRNNSAEGKAKLNKLSQGLILYYEINANQGQLLPQAQAFIRSNPVLAGQGAGFLEAQLGPSFRTIGTSPSSKADSSLNPGILSYANSISRGLGKPSQFILLPYLSSTRFFNAYTSALIDNQ